MLFRNLFHSDIKAVGNNNLNLISWNKYKDLYSLFEIRHEQLPKERMELKLYDTAGLNFTEVYHFPIFLFKSIFIVKS